MSVDSIKHPHADRPHIPSQEEAGTEAASPVLRDGKAKAEYPKNPVVHRGQDPELFWLGKYGEDDNDDRLHVDIRSLYRTEHVAPETLIANLHRVVEADPRQPDLFSVNELFGNALDHDELSKVSEYYQHRDGWTNRLIQGDSLLVMSSLLEREGMAGQVQMVYIDPPYGIKYGSNWQMRLNDRTVTDGKDEHVSGEPEVIKAYRDTWELGIHSYLNYLRDRLVIARELLNDSGSVFVQISDENVHLVRSLLDETFGSDNFVSQIAYKKTSGASSTGLASVFDYILWYAKSKDAMKYRQMFLPKVPGGEGAGQYTWIEHPNGRRENLGKKADFSNLPKGARLFVHDNLTSQRPAQGGDLREFEFEGQMFTPGSGTFKTDEAGLTRLAQQRRLMALGNTLRYVRYFDDFPVYPLDNFWSDTVTSGFSDPKRYVVQTLPLAIQRCVLMTTDPGELVLDPTCGSGTTAYVAEEWGRRWVTVDSSRIALTLTKQRLLTAVYPYYRLHDEAGGDIRQGFVYKTAPHVMLSHITRGEEPGEETLYDQPKEDKSRLRVAGPFTVETLQAFEPVSPSELDAEQPDDEEAGRFEEQVFEHLKSAGIKNGIREEQAVFSRVDRRADAYLHAEGYYTGGNGEERKAYVHIGPRFGSVSKQAVNEAVKAARRKGDADWLVILGFAFESNIENQTQTTSLGQFEVTKVRMHDDLLQEGLLKKDKKAASFVTIGEPDVAIHCFPSLEAARATPPSREVAPMPSGAEGVTPSQDTPTRYAGAPSEGAGRGKEAYVTVEVRGLDIYDPIKDQVKARSVADISYWMVDDDYDGSSFVVRQVFFCGGPKDAFDKWRKGLDDLAVRQAKRSLERTLKIEVDEEAFARLYGFTSHPIPVKGAHHQIAVRVVSQFGEESTKVLQVPAG